MARYSTYRTEAVGSPAANKGARTVMRALAYHLAALKFPTFQCKNQSESTQIRYAIRKDMCRTIAR